MNFYYKAKRVFKILLNNEIHQVFLKFKVCKRFIPIDMLKFSISKLSLFIFTLMSINFFAGIGELLPKPQKVVSNKEKFVIGNIQIKSDVLKKEWSELILEFGGKVSNQANQKIEVIIREQIPQLRLNPEEGYVLSVKNNTIKIEATNERGVYWAMQTLKQLVVKNKNAYFEGCEITDYPAFRIRGFMQDVGRTFISLEELKREISTLSKYKINVFHWHLTENQGWRLESKKYPQLNALSSYERMAGKFYTLEEAKELVEFCKANNVLLIPEIDMPGHSKAFEKAFGVTMQSEQGMVILKDLLEELIPYFDVPYLHIGTDEVEFTNPKFVPEMVEFIRNRGKKVISWNPGWNYKQGEIDMTQLWSYRGKAQKGIPAIDSRFHYINHFDQFSDLIALYNSKILNVNEGSADHAGGIMAVWHDRFITDEQDIILQNNFYPSMLAFAERSWLGGGSEYFDKNGTILPTDQNDSIFKEFADFERRMLWHKQNNFKNLPFAYVKQTEMVWNITDAFPNNGDLTKVFPPESKICSTYNFEGKTYETKKAIGAGIYLRHVWGKLVPTFYKNPQPNHTAYAYTYIYSPKNQEVGLWFGTQNYSRSEKDLPPPQGKWDYKESKLWINGKEILPPKWESSHTELSNEIPLTNENFEVRPPLPISLNKGWNKVLIKLPIGQFNSKPIRLVKWQFAFALVTKDGKNRIEGLKFNPNAKTCE